MTTYDNYNMCFLARVELELVTPLHTASGRGGIKSDSLINRDVNGLPYIPATTLTGLIRHAIGTESDSAKRMMGYLGDEREHGSFLSVSEAKIVVDSTGRAADGLTDLTSEYLKGFKQMPIRQHVKITQKGVAASGAKFDEEIVPKGVRFCFEMELRGDADGCADFNSLLEVLTRKSFRVGGGTRNGFGEIRIVKISYRALDFSVSSDLDAYIGKSSSLAEVWSGYMVHEIPLGQSADVIHYELKLKPRDFVMFGAGFGDDRSDMSVVREPFVTWTANGPVWETASESLVVPASSLKGAIAHRTAYYYNYLTRHFADDVVLNNSNYAVEALFGSSKGSDAKAHRGCVLFSDLVRKTTSKTKVINHVKIDGFTSGAIAGALFAEDPLYAKGEELDFSLMLLKDDLAKAVEGLKCEETTVLKAFELALQDICKSILPLGGGVNRGNGCMCGTLCKDGKQIYSKTPIDNE